MHAAKIYHAAVLLLALVGAGTGIYSTYKIHTDDGSGSVTAAQVVSTGGAGGSAKRHVSTLSEEIPVGLTGDGYAIINQTTGLQYFQVQGADVTLISYAMTSTVCASGDNGALPTLRIELPFTAVAGIDLGPYVTYSLAGTEDGVRERPAEQLVVEQDPYALQVTVSGFGGTACIMVRATGFVSGA